VRWLYYLARFLAVGLVSLLLRLEVRGKENIPVNGPVLVVANHVNLIDPVLLGISFRRRLRFIAKEELFRSRVGNVFFRGIGAFPVHRGGMNLEAFRQAEQVLAAGMALAIFPEGRRSQSGQLRPAFSGASLIASRREVPILPVGIIGTGQIKGATWWLRRPHVKVIIGAPFYLPSTPAANGNLNRSELAKSTSVIMGRISELLPDKLRGDYSKRETGDAEH